MNKMKKRVSLLLAALVASTFLIACGKKEEPAPAPEPAPEPTAEEKLLAEIRDLLKNK